MVRDKLKKYGATNNKSTEKLKEMKGGIKSMNEKMILKAVWNLIQSGLTAVFFMK